MKKTTLIIAAFALLAACTPFDFERPETVDNVDLARYAGKWYEIASIPQFFNVGCNCTTAEYSANDDGTIKVVNTCRLNSPDGPINEITGKAQPVSGSNNAKLNVTFLPKFQNGSNYWILELAPDYSYAVVSDPGKNTFFLLSRTPTMPQPQVDDILERMDMIGIDISKVKMTPQACS